MGWIAGTPCAWCKREIKTGEYNIGGIYFCSLSCKSAFEKSNGNSQTSAASSSDSGSSANVVDVAAAGIGAVGAGAGAVLKGAGAVVNGTGALIGAAANGLNSMINGVNNQFGATRSAEKQIRAIQSFQMPADPEEYKSAIFVLFDKATTQPADPIRDPYVIKAAKNKVIHELDMLKIKNPDFYVQFQPMYEQLINQKSKGFFANFFGGLFGGAFSR